jgi:2-oxoisovalerate dehydrogenase E1 component alpha subunit
VEKRPFEDEQEMWSDAIVRPSNKLTEETLLEMYWYMLLSRRLDERAWVLHRQGKVTFHVSAMGHEAAQVGAAFAINRGVDYVAPYYRDLSLSLAVGSSATDFMMSLFAKHGDRWSGGRQMPSHFSDTRYNIISGSSVVATQVPQAAGLAFAIQYKQRLGMVDAADKTQPRLALACLGEGSTSQGEWHEGMNWAGVHQLPFICLVQNNGYAISVPVDLQMTVPSVADRASAYGVKGVTVDGMDVLAVYDAMKAAAERAYSGEGATLVEARCYRLTPHSSDDDDRSYRSREEVDEWKGREPVSRFAAYLREQGVLTEAKSEELDARVLAEVDAAQKIAEDAPQPQPQDAVGAVYAAEVRS